MSTYHGIAANTIYPQPGFSVTQNENGGFEASCVYAMRSATWNNLAIRSKFRPGTAILTLDPDRDSYYSFLKIDRVSDITHEDGDIVTVSVSFTGSEFAQYAEGGGVAAESLPTYRLEGRVSDKPFGEHPKFKALAEAERITLERHMNREVLYLTDGAFGAGYYYNADPGNYLPAGDQVTSADGIQFRNLISNGITNYLVPTVLWTETTQGDSGMTAAQLNSLGHISTPRGNPPTPTGSRNWMLTGASQEQQGELYQTTIEWTLSEREGHSTFLYES